MRIKETKVYSFDELTEKAREVAINDHIEFMLETTEYEQGSDNFKKAIQKAEDMQTPWFAGSYIYEYCLHEILADIEANEYEFTEDGRIA